MRSPEGLRHFLIVPEHAGDDLVVLHDRECPREQWGHEPNSWWDYGCWIAVELSNTGVDAHFVHRDDPDTSNPYADRLAPGRYEIETWTVRYPGNGWGPEEWDGGLRVVEPDVTVGHDGAVETEL